MRKLTVLTATTLSAGMLLTALPANAVYIDDNPNTIDASSFGLSSLDPTAQISRMFTLPHTDAPKISSRIFWPGLSTWSAFRSNKYQVDSYVNAARRMPQNINTTFNRAVNSAFMYRFDRSNFATELIYTLWGTPGASYSKYTKKQLPSECFKQWAPGTPAISAAPKIGPYKQYVKDVYSAYFGRINAFEIWNEVDAYGFFCGTSKDLANMTFAAKEAIDEVYKSKKGKAIFEDGKYHKVDKARVLAPNFTRTAMAYSQNLLKNQPKSSAKITNEQYIKSYYRNINVKPNLPVDAATIHPYGDHVQRYFILAGFKKFVKDVIGNKKTYRGNSLAFYDTESNVAVPGSSPHTANMISTTLIHGITLGYSHQQLYAYGEDSYLAPYADFQATSRNNQVALANTTALLNNSTLIDVTEHFLGNKEYQTLKFKRDFFFGATTATNHVLHNNQYLTVTASTKNPYYHLVVKRDGSRSPIVVLNSATKATYPNGASLPRDKAGNIVFDLVGTNTVTFFEGIKMCLDFHGPSNC